MTNPDYTIPTVTPVADNYDLTAACNYNGIAVKPTGILLEITGENDAADWHWLVTTETGFAYITGGCDYTGWDCQSSAEAHEAATFEGALALVGEVERHTFRDMLAKGETVRVNSGSFYGNGITGDGK